jgi:hypothetical protein
MYPAKRLVTLPDKRPIKSEFSRTSQMRRTEICSVRNRKCLEDTPRKPLNYATDEEHLERLGEEWDEHSR